MVNGKDTLHNAPNQKKGERSPTTGAKKKKGRAGPYSTGLKQREHRFSVIPPKKRGWEEKKKKNVTQKGGKPPNPAQPTPTPLPQSLPTFKKKGAKDLGFEPQKGGVGREQKKGGGKLNPNLRMIF